MADFPPIHRAELANMTLVAGYIEASEYTVIEPLSGELLHRVRLEVHGSLEPLWLIWWLRLLEEQ